MRLESLRDRVTALAAFPALEEEDQVIGVGATLNTHWQRSLKPRYEALWDYVVGKLLHVPVPGIRLDRMMSFSIPHEVSQQIDEDLSTYVEDPRLVEDEAGPSESWETDERPFYVEGTLPHDESTSDDDAPRVIRTPFYVGSSVPRDERPSDDDAPCVKARVPLCPAEPILFTQNSLRILWEGAMDAQSDRTQPHWLQRRIPVGQYDLAVIPTGGGRIRPAVRAVLQGMQHGKEIEIFTPSAFASHSSARTVIAIWTYQDASMAVVHLDFQYKERYILWHAPDGHHFNFDYPEELRLRLSTLNLEVPGLLDGILST